MRILVTKQGNVIIKDIDDTPMQILPSTLPTKRGLSTGHSSNLRTLTLGNKNNNTLGILSPPKRPFYPPNTTTTLISFYRPKVIRKAKSKPGNTSEENDIPNTEIKGAKPVKLSQHKISFPKNFAEKYEKTSLDNSSNIISTAGNILPTLANKTNEFSSYGNRSLTLGGEKYFSFNEIIPNKTVTEMKKKIISDRKERNKASRITENDFRSMYTEETDIMKFNNILNYPRLNANKSSLIRYLNEKKVDPKALDTLFHCDTGKLNRINKLCQINFQNEESEKLFNDLIKEKLKQKVSNTKKDFQNEISTIDHNMKRSLKKIEKYNKKVDNREKYREIFNDFIIHNWFTRDLDRLNKKSTPQSKYVNNNIY